MDSYRTLDSEEFLQWSGVATVASNGSILVELKNSDTMSGTWLAIPKDQWPQSDDVDLRGMYNLTTEIAGRDGTYSWTAYVAKVADQNKYLLVIIHAETNYALYFTRAM